MLPPGSGEKPPKKVYKKYAPGEIPERFKNKGPTPREREQDRIDRETLQMAMYLRQLEVAKELGKDLRRFLKAAWPVLSPGVTLTPGWHLDALCAHTQAVFEGQIKRLIISIPPRSMKSKIISIAAPAWWWINHPEEQFLCASYSRSLAMDFSRQTRNLIQSNWYQLRWKENFKLSYDQNEKFKFENDKGGSRVGYSVEGGLIGAGGSVSLYDDPNDLNEMSSPAYRQMVKDWYSGTASSRFINPQTDRRICVQQRASYGDDLTSFLLELGGWEHLIIPMEFDGNKRVSSIGWSDPRAHMGELMHPARFGPIEIDQLKKEQRDNFSGQFNQKPVGSLGDTLKSSWFRFYNPSGTDRRNELGEIIPVVVSTGDGESVKITPIQLPAAFEQMVTSVDCAFKNAEHNDFVAAHAWGRLGANVFLVGREHGHMSFTETKAMMRRFANLYPCPEKLVEDAANGPAILDELKNEIPGLIGIPAYGPKRSRVAAIAGYVEAGNVYLPNPDIYPWVWDLLREFADGRSSKHDDDTDAMSQALKRLYDAMAHAGVPEFRVQPRRGIGEPSSACHISSETVPPQWRRMVAVVPGRAAVWIAETPTGSLRVLRELSLEKLDAAKAGLEIGRRSLSDCLARNSQIRDVKRQVYELFFPKEAFAAIEPVGSYAEMVERSILTFEPEEGDWDIRNQAREALKAAHFRSDMIEEEEVSLDRLRGLLAFQPPDFKQVPYERGKAMILADQDMQKYSDYMASVENVVRGEWPKLKIHPDCKELISQLGSFRRDKPKEMPAFVQALLLGICCPLQNKPHEVTERPWPAGQQRGMRNQKLMSRKFAMR